jgi:hypothetical protein
MDPTIYLKIIIRPNIIELWLVIIVESNSNKMSRIVKMNIPTK